MKLVYCEKWGRKVAATDDKILKSDRIKPGYVLYAMSCFAYAPDRTVGDNILLSVRSGGQDVCLRHRKHATANLGLSVLNPFLVGEGDQVIASFPDADAGNTIELCINGILYSLDEWRKL